jgi:hypothetical protein
MAATADAADGGAPESEGLAGKREPARMTPAPAPKLRPTAQSARLRFRLRTPGSFSGHSFARTECEQTFANATKIAEFSRIIRLRTSFGTTSLPTIANQLKRRIASNKTAHHL